MVTVPWSPLCCNEIRSGSSLHSTQGAFGDFHPVEQSHLRVSYGAVLTRSDHEAMTTGSGHTGSACCSAPLGWLGQPPGL